MREQHDHHCLLTFQGYNWRIGACRPHRIHVYRSTQYPEPTGRWVLAEINTRDVDWEAYAEAAQVWDFRRDAC